MCQQELPDAINQHSSAFAFSCNPLMQLWGRLNTPVLSSREQSRSSSFLSHTQRSLLPLFASLTNRNLPFTVRRSRKGKSQALQLLFLLFVLGTVLSQEVQKRKNDVKTTFSSSIYPALEPRVAGENISHPVPLLTPSSSKQRHSAGAGI